MKKHILLIALILGSIIACFAGAGADFASIDVGAIDFSGVYAGSGIISATMALIWIKDSKFIELTKDQFDALSDEEQKQYHEALLKHRLDKETAMALRIKELEDKQDVSDKEISELKTLKDEFNGLSAQTIKDMLESLKVQGEEIKRLQHSGGVSKNKFEETIKAKFDSIFGTYKGSSLNEMRSFLEEKRARSISFEVDKATQTYGDIDSAEDFAQERAGIVDLPVRKPRFRSLFKTIPLASELYKYLRQATVVRNAQNVAVCSAITGTTKETLIVETIGVKKVKDIIKFCLDFIADYPFMMSRIRLLIDSSLALKVDQQILLGTGLTTELNSIDSTASEFNAANAVCDVSLAVQSANYIDLMKAMKTQVVALGQDNAYDPDIVIVNKCDWFIEVDSLKDANDNYLAPRGVTFSNGNWYIDGMLVVYSPIVAQNTAYVVDSTKVEIIDRKVLSLEISTENATDWESEIASLKGFERLNVFVDPNNQNALMKCSDVATAITAITSL